MRIRRAAVAAIMIVAAVALLPRCGASGPRREYTKADQKLAAEIGLRAGDFAPDWRADPATGKNDVPTHCYDGIWRHLVITGEAAAGFFEGPKEFSTGPNYASSHVVVFASRGTALSALIRLRKTGSLRCLASDMKNHLFEKPTVKHVAVRPLKFTALGEHSTASDLAIDFPASSFSPRAYLDAVLVQHGRVFILLLFGDVGNPFDPALRRQVSREVAARMSRN